MFLRGGIYSGNLSEVSKKLSLIFSFEDLTASDISMAADMQREDFEDELQAAAAKRIHADHIITRNVKDFRKSEVIAFTPPEFVSVGLLGPIIIG